MPSRPMGALHLGGGGGAGGMSPFRTCIFTRLVQGIFYCYINTIIAIIHIIIIVHCNCILTVNHTDLRLYRVSHSKNMQGFPLDILKITLFTPRCICLEECTIKKLASLNISNVTLTKSYRLFSCVSHSLGCAHWHHCGSPARELLGYSRSTVAGYGQPQIQIQNR